MGRGDPAGAGPWLRTATLIMTEIAGGHDSTEAQAPDQRARGNRGAPDAAGYWCGRCLDRAATAKGELAAGDAASDPNLVPDP